MVRNFLKFCLCGKILPSLVTLNTNKLGYIVNFNLLTMTLFLINKHI